MYKNGRIAAPLSPQAGRGREGLGISRREAITSSHDTLADRSFGAAERRMGDFLLGAAVAGMVALFAAVSLGFGAFAAYAYLQASQGRVVAALILCAAFGATAIAIWAIAMARRRARRVAPRREGVVGARRGYRFASTTFGRGWRPTGPTGVGRAAGTRAFADAASCAGARWRIHRGEKTREVR